MLIADETDYLTPKIVNWPLTKFPSTYSLKQQQLSERGIFDFLSSFRNMPIKRSQRYVIQELSKLSFEYKLVETAFVQTSGDDIGNCSYDSGEVLKIEKIYNPTIFDKFVGELRR